MVSRQWQSTFIIFALAFVAAMSNSDMVSAIQPVHPARDIYEKTTPHAFPTVVVYDLTARDSSRGHPIKVHTRTTVMDIISQANPSAAQVDEVILELILMDTKDRPILDHHLGWLADDQKLYIHQKDTKSGQSAVRRINVFRNGAAENGVTVVISPTDTVASVVDDTSMVLGVPAVFLDDQPPARLFDEGGMEVHDTDLGWLQNDANLYIVPASRFFVWPSYPVGTNFVVKHPLSPLEGRHIELQVLSDTSPRLFKISNFLKEEEMDELIANARPTLEGSVTGANADGTHQQRTSTNAWDHSTGSAKALIQRAFDLVRVPYHRDLRDAIQVLHYDQYDRYITHTDWFGTGFKNWNTSEIGGTNRYVTIFFYLSDVEAGGHTAFPDADPFASEPYSVTQEEWDHMPEGARSISVCEPGYRGMRVPAKRGDAILFYSQDPDGRLDRQTRHAACPVIKGEKWAANVWIWNGPRPEMKAQKSSPNSISFTFKNLRTSAVQILYSDDDGEESFFSTVNPGEGYEVTTYLHHAWVFRRVEDLAKVGMYRVKRGHSNYKIQ